MQPVFVDYIPAGQPNPMQDKKAFTDYVPEYVPTFKPEEVVEEVKVEEPKVEVKKKKGAK